MLSREVISGRCLAVATLFFAGAVVATAAPSVALLESTRERLLVDVTLALEDLDSAFAEIAAGESGTTGILIIVPPGTETSLRVVEQVGRPVAPNRLPPTARLSLPTVPARLAETAVAGRHQLQRIELAPITQRADGGLRLHTWLRLEVKFRSIAGPSLAKVVEPTLPRRSAIGSAIAGVAVNGTAGISWRLAAEGQEQAGATPTVAQAGPPVGCTNCVKLEVVEDGIYRLSHGDLIAAGFDPALYDPRNLSIYMRGNEVPIEVDGQADGRFDSVDQIVFVGKRNRERFTDTTLYWLFPGTSPGLRIPERPAVGPDEESLEPTFVVTDVLRVEEANEFARRLPNAEGKDPWMSWFLASNIDDGPDAVTLPTSSTSLDAADLASPQPRQDYRLSTRFVGLLTGSAADDQGTDISVNGTPVLSAQWVASQELIHEVTGTYDPSLLVETGNLIRVEQPPPANVGEWRQNYIDWVELEYPRRLEARVGRIDFPGGDDPALYYIRGFTRSAVRLYAEEGTELTRLSGPRWLSAGPGMPATFVFAHKPTGQTSRFLASEPASFKKPVAIFVDAPSDLRSLPAQNFIVIAHPRLVGQSQALAAKRGGIVVDITNIYDEFNNGIEDSRAVRDFIAFAVNTWSTEYVLLVGDASFDYRNHLGLVAADYDPPSMVHSREVYLTSVQNFRAGSDSWFGAVAGSDFLPDVLIGRIPARTPGELADYLGKVDSYEFQAAGTWMKRIQLFADDVPGDPCGVQGIFADDLEATAVSYLNPLSPNIRRMYSASFPAPNDLRNAVVIDLNAGVGLQVYSGHGNAVSMARHCVNGAFPILDFVTLDQINNGLFQPLGVAMTCDAVEFDYAASFGGTPVIESIAEHYMMAPDRGYIGWIGTTSILLYSTGLDLTDALFSVLYAGDPIGPPENRILGSIGYGVMLKTFSTRGLQSRDGIETLVVLGDPAMQIRATTP